LRTVWKHIREHANDSLICFMNPGLQLFSISVIIIFIVLFEKSPEKKIIIIGGDKH